jgi:photosystem II stability/assembly factor-like uncharacterized protein
MKFIKLINLIFISYIITSTNIIAGNKINTDSEDKESNAIYSGLKFRHIGPALMSGRISDIIIHPENQNIWYVTAGSGGIWKTENSGTTWKSIFDSEKSYSIGCIALDPQNSNIIWAGTGENVGGRHVAYGDGIYKSEDGGETWKNMGLKTSEHLSKIIIHPQNSNIIWVASQGPLWSKGGERGIYKSTDGGKTWIQKLGDNEWIGATDLIIDPRNPNLLYAATWQRHRTVAGYMGGGPGTNIYKSNDEGETWQKINSGLPKSNMGKIGLAISPQKPDVIYAAIELNRRKGGVYKSENQGASWKKMSDAVAGGTGPHYYQELYASPHNFDKLYLADNYMQVSSDGGKTFTRMNETEKHVDNHAVAFKKNDPNYILVGCDGGLYESFDNTKNWKFIDNLPLTQFYKIAVDDSKPFYYIYGGTQDNNTQGAPSRTDNIHGIRNSDWFILLGGDGHQPATEPNNPNIVYVQWQRGNLNRHDRITGENTNIKPQPEIGEKSERFNWDSPILVSPHNSKRLYFASQRVWKSEDRGDSWNPISDDLTNDIKRVKTPFFGKQQKWDNAWDLYAMSNYSTITSISESPIKEGLLYAGTDDGIIQITENGGLTWRKVDFKKISSLPNTAFVNDIKADLFDENIVYAVFDNHKYGDYKSYLFKSDNKGKTWQKIGKDLPENTILWRIVQDHVDSDLMFLGTEFGVYFSNNQGKNWKQLKNGVPNISVRDIAIQKRENDLILGTFGRGIYILDDYSSLRYFDESKTKKEAILFTPRDAFWYKQKRVLGGRVKAAQGDGFYIAENPPFGINLTYYLKEDFKSKKSKRIKKEKELEKENQEITVPEWEILEEEKNEIEPMVWLFIYSSNDQIIRKIKAKNKKGFNRVNWDLKSESANIISDKNINKDNSGPLAAPGNYAGQLYKQIDGNFYAITDKIKFNVKPLRSGSLPGNSYNIVVKFWEDVNQLRDKANNLSSEIKEIKNKTNAMIKAYERARYTDESLQDKILELRNNILNLEQKINGSNVRSEIGEQNEYPRMRDYIWAASGSSTYGPTEMHRKSLSNAKKLFTELNSEYILLNNSINPLILKLEKIEAPLIKD